MNIKLMVKYFFDKIFAVIFLLFFAPLFLIVAFAIWFEDKGEIFFLQNRLGIHGRLFRIWKFRSMIENADIFLNQDGSVSVDRITKVGRLLRRSSMDELPQLINILKGDMSFIGPRPALPSHFYRYTNIQKKRLTVKPGITGLAQVNGRNTLSWSKRIDLDIEYIDNYSLLLDLLILAKTIKTVFLQEGMVMDRNPDEVDDLL